MRRYFVCTGKTKRINNGIFRGKTLHFEIMKNKRFFALVKVEEEVKDYLQSDIPDDEKNKRLYLKVRYAKQLF